MVGAGSSFKYDFRIPSDQPPGLYWYHPHVHELSDQAVLGGASGAISSSMEFMTPSPHLSKHDRFSSCAIST